MTFWGGSGSGSANPCLWLMDPDLSWIRILLFSSLTFKMPAKKLFFNTIFSAYYFLKVHLHHFSKIKCQKYSQNSRNQGFSYYFCMMIEGSGSGSIPLTSGSGSASLALTVRGFLWKSAWPSFQNPHGWLSKPTPLLFKSAARNYKFTLRVFISSAWVIISLLLIVLICLVLINYTSSVCFSWCILVLLIYSCILTVCSDPGMVNLCCTVKKLVSGGTGAM